MERFDMIPLLHVKDMEASTGFYIDGLGFELKDEWVVDGVRRWFDARGAGEAAVARVALPAEQEGTPDPNLARSAEQTAVEHLCHALLAFASVCGYRVKLYSLHRGFNIN